MFPNFPSYFVGLNLIRAPGVFVFGSKVAFFERKEDKIHSIGVK